MAFGDCKDATNPSMTDGLKAFAGLNGSSIGWQLEVRFLPFTTTLEEILNIFVKYGTIDKVGQIINAKEKSLDCFLMFENSSHSDDALNENGKKVGVQCISVTKCTTSSDADKGKKRLRTDDNGSGWGSSGTTNTISASDGWGSTGSSTANGGNTADSSGGWGTSASTGDSWGSGGDSSSGGSRGRGRGRGGAGGGGGGRSCFNCGDEGHMSRECPKPKKADSRSCFRCGEDGHISSACPKGPKGGGRSCFNCNEEGHMSRECPKPKAERGRGRGRGGRGGGGGGGGGSSFSGNEWASNEADTKPAVSSEPIGWD